MTTRNISLAVGEFYHIYNRGVDRRTIYLDLYDYRRFVELLYLCNSASAINIRNIHRDFTSAFKFDTGNPLVAIGAYCLMPNHFHLLVTPLIDGGLTTFMGKLGTGYSMYFNKKYNRTGGLFEGRFKAEHANTDEYLKYLYAYIHLNPVKLIQFDWKESGIRDIERTKQYLSGYKYSSLLDYFGGREESGVIDTTKFPEYFRNKNEVDAELLEWLTYRTFTT